MALVMKKSSNWWYARIGHNGSLRQYPLTDLQDGVETRIPIEGRRPSSIKRLEEGDRIFLISHARAKAAHDRLVQLIRDGDAAEDLANKLLESATGEKREKVLLADMPQRWAELPRRKKLSDSHRKSGMRVLNQFADFVKSRREDCRTMSDVPASLVEAYMRTLDRNNASPRTWNFKLGILKHAYHELSASSPAYRNFFEKAKRRTEDTVHREPFTDDEMVNLLEAVKKDTVLRGPVIASVYSGLRRGDACTLEWSALDRKKGFLLVPTRKTGEHVLIPILPQLASELKRVRRKGKYIFPEAAELYLNRDKGELQTRFNGIMREAGFDVRRKTDAQPIIRADIPRLSKKETDKRVAEALKGSDFQDRKKKNMDKVYEAYADGASVKETAKIIGVSVSTVSIYLNTLEEITGCAILRGGRRSTETEEPATIRSDDYENRTRRPSTKGWHSLRTTFVTLALQIGMPEELLRKVTGHATVDVVRKHYFDPSDEVLAKAFNGMSGAFNFGQGGAVEKQEPASPEEIKTMLATMNADNWKVVRKNIMKLI